MRTSAQLILEQLEVIIDNKKITDQGGREVHEQLDGKEVLNPHNPSSALSTVLNTINNKFEHELL
jgi:hypothetical protein